MLYPTQIRWVENHKYLLTLLADCSCGSAPGPDPHCWAQRVPMAATHPLLGPSWGQWLSSAPQGVQRARASALCQEKPSPSCTSLRAPHCSVEPGSDVPADVAGGNAKSHPRFRTGGGDGAACIGPQINASTKSAHICLLPLIPFCSHFCFRPISRGANQAHPYPCQQPQPGEDRSPPQEFKDPRCHLKITAAHLVPIH